MKNVNELQISGIKAIAAAAALLLCGSLAWGQAPPSGGPPEQNPGPTAGQNPQNPSMNPGMNQAQTMGAPSAMDKAFVRSAMEGSNAEIQLGKLTLQKSDNQQVKQFAQRMIDDHTKLNEQMAPVAQQLGIPVTSQISKKDRKTMAKLQGLSGSAYDQAYISDMVKDHHHDLREFQNEASSGQDPAVKDAASQGSKVIAEHLQLAEQLAKDQNVSVSGQ